MNTTHVNRFGETGISLGASQTNLQSNNYQMNNQQSDSNDSSKANKKDDMESILEENKEETTDKKDSIVPKIERLVIFIESISESFNNCKNIEKQIYTAKHALIIT